MFLLVELCLGERSRDLNLSNLAHLFEGNTVNIEASKAFILINYRCPDVCPQCKPIHRNFANDMGPLQINCLDFQKQTFPKW